MLRRDQRILPAKATIPSLANALLLNEQAILVPKRPRIRHAPWLFLTNLGRPIGQLRRRGIGGSRSAMIECTVDSSTDAYAAAESPD